MCPFRAGTEACPYNSFSVGSYAPGRADLCVRPSSFPDADAYSEAAFYADQRDYRKLEDGAVAGFLFGDSAAV
jgi:hypothetical protein